MKKRVAILLCALLLVVTTLVLLRRVVPRTSPLPAGLKGNLNIVLLTIDTLRADHLECYGYLKVPTPNINRLAAEGIRFEQAISQAPLTLPAHSTIFTGTSPLFHGVRDNGGFYLDEKHATLAEEMKRAGYRTGGFVGAFVLDSRWGVDQGFDYYFDHFDLTKYKKISLDAVQRRGDEVLAEARNWIGQTSAGKFFAWIHLYDPHTPYNPPEPYKTQYQGPPYGLYDGEIAYVDELIGEFLEFLQEKGLIDRTLIILTADHGESLGEHKESAHGFFIYDAAIRVPLIIRLPGTSGPRGTVVGAQVRSVDIMPTALALAGIPVPPAVQGSSLLPFILGKDRTTDVPAYSETYFPRYHYGWSELKSVRGGRYKFIDAPSPELYDVVEDPGEEHNLVNEKASIGLRLKRDLEELVARDSAPGGEPAGPRNIDHDSLVKLQALGYIGAFRIPSAEKKTGDLADPKDKIELYNEIKLAQFFSSEENYDIAERKVRAVLEKDPSILEARYLAGNICFKQKRYPEAVQEFQRALEVDPEYYEAIFGLALVFKDSGKLEDSIIGFRRCLDMDPRDTKPYFHLTDIYIDQNKFDEALRSIQAAVKIDPESPLLRNRLGAVYLELKRFDEAEREIKAALAVERSQPLINAHFNLALVHEARGEPDLAIAEYRREQETAPYNFHPDFNLGLLWLKGRRLSEAEAEFRSCLSKNEDHAPAYIFLAKVLMDAGKDLPEAETLALKGLDLGPDRSTEILAHFLLADIYNRQGDPARAARHLEAARRLQESRTGT